MPMIEWNDELSICIAEIDQQHQKWLTMVNEFYDSMTNGSSDEIMLKIIGRMRLFAERHFGMEEELMQRHQASFVEEHAKEHQAFLDKFVQVEIDYRAKKKSVTLDVLNFLNNWLLTHINDTDKKMGQFLVSKGLS
ncbi:bacteriohemerythrin [Desulforhopalus singaporensis]|uniref:Hemerythrin-like metal-binding domain protein n=1 Tax=Desulforhopalus singaporensis TaxID=91360 RepID=A0A1H0STF4_9BACT|nr:bacteriohemerythrin [Desulforhopalus singaporensis]SDP45013.1 hemerythrin-like metal-binding domain protein [Desulforhopalus singaporensis]